MAVADLILHLGITGVALNAAFAFLVCGAIYRIFLHPIASIPGPAIASITSLWIYYHSWAGDEATQIAALHRRHGPVVRVAPDAVHIADGRALATVYTEGGGFLKAAYYRNFDIEGHATIFSTLDPAYRRARTKAVLGLFAPASVYAGAGVLAVAVDKFTARLQEEVKEAVTGGRPVDVLNLTRALAVDGVTSYLFGKSYGGLDEPPGELSASQFVNSFVAVGRFFYLPTYVFGWVERVVALLWSDAKVDASMDKVDRFCAELVQVAASDEEEKKENDKGRGSDTYQARLLRAGISQHETEQQCKDLIFAGTDSTGMTLACICWQLAGAPKAYARLRDELAAHADVPPDRLQSLPFLRAVILEGLRLAMPNPTRLPRAVPPSGWHFGGHQFPPGTVVALSSHQLHLENSDVFPDPRGFRPERWLDPSPEMLRDAIPFGLGSRQCIARNLATAELYIAVERLIRADALKGARRVRDQIEILEWFNSKVIDEKVELVWH